MIPTDEQFIKEIRAISTLAPNLMVCNNCKHFDRATSECEVTHYKMAPFVRGCNGMYFLTREEEMLAKAKKEIQEEMNDCEKLENLLALVITMIAATGCFNEDMHSRLTKLRARQKDKKQRSLLRKDLDMCEDIQRALERISEITDSMAETLQVKLEEIDQQHRMYIEPYVNRLFCKNGKWDTQRGDGFLNNQFEICRLVGKFVKGCICNEKNYRIVFGLLDSLENDHPYGLTHEDLDHYKLKGFKG